MPTLPSLSSPPNRTSVTISNDAHLGVQLEIGARRGRRAAVERRKLADHARARSGPWPETPPAGAALGRGPRAGGACRRLRSRCRARWRSAIRGAAPGTSSIEASRISRVSAVLPNVSPSRATERMRTIPAYRWRRGSAPRRGALRGRAQCRRAARPSRRRRRRRRCAPRDGREGRTARAGAAAGAARRARRRGRRAGRSPRGGRRGNAGATAPRRHPGRGRPGARAATGPRSRPRERATAVGVFIAFVHRSNGWATAGLSWDGAHFLSFLLVHAGAHGVARRELRVATARCSFHTYMKARRPGRPVEARSAESRPGRPETDQTRFASWRIASGPAASSKSSGRNAGATGQLARQAAHALGLQSLARRAVPGGRQRRVPRARHVERAPCPRAPRARRAKRAAAGRH